MRFKAKSGAGDHRGGKALFLPALPSWQGVRLELPGPSWVPGEEGEATQTEELRQQGWERASVTRSEPPAAAVPGASHLWTSQFREPVNSPLCESYFQLSVSRWKASRLTLEG